VEDAENQLDREDDKQRGVGTCNEARSILKTIWCRKHRWLGHVLRHDNLLYDIIDGKMLGKATWGRKKMELLHDMMEGRDYGHLKD